MNKQILFGVLAVLMVSSSASAVTLTCDGRGEFEGMQMVLSAENWTKDSVSGNVSVSFFSAGRKVMEDKNGGFSDSPYVIGAHLALPDSELMPTLIVLTRDFKFAKVDMYDAKDDFTFSYGRYRCR